MPKRQYCHEKFPKSIFDNWAKKNFTAKKLTF